MILGVLIFLVGMCAITIIIEQFSMTPGAMLIWGYASFGENSIFFGKETTVSIPPPRILYGGCILKSSSFDYFSGRLNISYLSEDYDAEEWHGIMGIRMGRAAERIEVGDSVKLHKGIATVVRPGPIKEYEPVASVYLE